MEEGKPEGQEEMFNAKGIRKVNLFPCDILCAIVPKGAPQNKTIFMKDGRKYELIDYTLKYITGLSHHLIQANRHCTVSKEHVTGQLKGFVFTLKGMPVEVGDTIKVSHTFRDKFIAHYHKRGTPVS
jgi:hypothetical protein